jgi:hypothetical protein
MCSARSSSVSNNLSVRLATYAATKSKYRYKLDVGPDMRIHLCTIAPSFKGLCETKKQHHSSH